MLLIHGSSCEAVQEPEQDGASERTVLNEPPLACTIALSGFRLNEHGAADWATASVWPAIRRRPCRLGPPLACALNVTVPAPVPNAVSTPVIQSTSDSTAQAQLEAAVTVVLLVPPSIGNETLVGEIENEQRGAAGVAA